MCTSFAFLIGCCSHLFLRPDSSIWFLHHLDYRALCFVADSIQHFILYYFISFLFKSKKQNLAQKRKFSIQVSKKRFSSWFTKTFSWCFIGQVITLDLVLPGQFNNSWKFCFSLKFLGKAARPVTGKGECARELSKLKSQDKYITPKVVQWRGERKNKRRMLLSLWILIAYSQAHYLWCSFPKDLLHLQCSPAFLLLQELSLAVSLDLSKFPRKYTLKTEGTTISV